MQTPASNTSNSNSWPADGYATATERNMATWGSEFWRNNQTSNQTANTPVNTPATPTQTEDVNVVKTEVVETPEIKQEWALKPLSQDYYDQTSQEAQDKIIANLNNYKQTNPEYFRDYESFKKNFSYDSRSDEQKNTLDTWYGGYQQGLQLSSLPVTDLYTQYKDGSISPNDLESLRISNPTKYAELQDTINRGNIIAAYDDDKGETWFANNIQEMAYNMLQQSFMQFMGGDSSSWASEIFRGYEEKMESPEMLALSDQTTEIQEQIENITSDLDAIKKSVEKEYEGTWASRAKINAIISDRSYDLQLQLRTLNSEYNKYATQYNNRMQQYQNEFNMQLQEYQINRQERQQQMQELGFAMDLMSFETPQQKQDREWNYRVKQQEYANGNINSKDYDTRYKAALNSVQNLLSQYEGIPMVRSAEEMADDILKAIDGGSNLGKELSKINQQIQQKPEYKYLYNNTYKTWSSNWIGKTFKIGDTEYIEYNGAIYNADQFNKLFGGVNGFTGATWNAKAYDVVDERALNPNPMSVAWYDGKNLGGFLTEEKNQAKKTGGQCGKFVNDYLQYIGMTDAANRYYDDELSTKLNSINTEVPKEGTVAVFDYNHISKATWRNHWHVGIVTRVTDDGIRVRDSNYSSDEKIKERFIPKGSEEWNNNLKGFFDPSQPPVNRTGTSSSSNNTQAGTAVDRLTLTALKNWQIVNSQVPDTIKKLVEAGFSEDEINTALNQNMQYYLPDDQRAEKNRILADFNKLDTVKNFQESATQLLALSSTISNVSGAADVATVFQFMKTMDPNSVVREWEFKQAAETAGLWGEIQTSLKKLENWEMLTPTQRENFFKVASDILNSKKQTYKIAYDDAVRQMKAASIPDVYYPTDRVAEIDNILAKIQPWMSTAQTTNNNSSNSKRTYMASRLNESVPTVYDTKGRNTVNINGSELPADFY